MPDSNVSSKRLDLPAHRREDGKLVVPGLTIGGPDLSSGQKPHHEREPVEGDLVMVKCADGTERLKIATSTIVDGSDFPVVWVAEVEGDWNEALPWPCEDVAFVAEKPEFMR